MSRLSARFARLKAENRAGLVTFVTACDPDRETSQRLLNGLPKAGADIVELGMPFTDPMADGVAIQLASQRALKAGGSLKSVLEMTEAFRRIDGETPVVLMGYYNPIHAWGVQAFCTAAAKAGVDGLIVVDLPPEEAGELAGPARAAGIDFIFLTAPTTDDARLPVVLRNASGFVYHVSVTGVTGAAAASRDAIESAVTRLRRHTDLPLAVGFGIKDAKTAAAVAELADAAVVGSAIVSRIAAGLDGEGKAKSGLTEQVLRFVEDLADGVRSARHRPV